MKIQQKQNRIIYLSVLAGLVYLFIIINSFSKGWDDIKTGYWVAGGEQLFTEDHPKTPGEVYFLKIKPRGGFQHFPEEIHNELTDEVYPARYESILIALPNGIEIPSMAKHFTLLQSLLVFCIFILYITIPIVFIKLIRFLYKGKVFDIQNIRYTRNLGIILILLYCCVQGTNYSEYRLHQAIFSVENYKHVFSVTDNYLLMMGAALLLTAEMLSRGLMLKEDQDLTI